MNRLIRIMCTFVLPFLCFLINVSYALEFSSTPFADSSTYLLSSNSNSSYFSNRTYGGYTLTQIGDVVSNYYTKTGDYESLYNNLVLALKTDNYNLTLVNWLAWGNSYPYRFILSKKNYFDIGIIEYPSRAKDIVFSPLLDNYDVYTDLILGSSSKEGNAYPVYYIDPNSPQSVNNVYTFSINSEIVDYINFSTVSIKKLSLSGGFIWDGTSYYYEVAEESESDTPSLPSNAEIAQAVQNFYNSDYYKNNKDFSDFIVLYNYNTQYFDFIGHNHGIDLGQVIVPADYTYENIVYNQPWWKFFLRNISSEIASNLWNRYYWLYSTNDFGENLTYEGKGSINDLLDLHFATSSIIVYSTTDYPVVKIETDEETGVLEPVEGTIPGDQYTYNENLDPTINEYNPLENFVPTNPVQNILGDVDFDEINKTFEENKDILNIENASWLFTANNKLINYFIGFLSILIVFLIISRILGG